MDTNLQHRCNKHQTLGLFGASQGMKEWRYEYTSYPNISCIFQPGRFKLQSLLKWYELGLYICFLHITSALPLFSALTAVFGEEHDLLLSLLRWAIGLEQKSTKDCQTLNCLHDARVHIWSMSFDSKWTSYSCSMIPSHNWKLWFGLYVFVRTKFRRLKLCFLSFLPVFSIWNWAKRQHFIHFGGTRRRCKCLQLSHWNMVATANRQTVVQLTLDVGEAD